MIAVAYSALFAITILALYRRFRGRTVEQLIRRPPRGADLNTIVSTLSYLEHELIKHRIPVLRGLMAKRIWNNEDRALLLRTVGRAGTSLVDEFDRYLEGVQRGAARTLVNFGRDRPFHLARRHLGVVQRLAGHWQKSKVTPEPQQRAQVNKTCDWLAGPFRAYLVELGRTVNRVELTQGRLQQSARRGLAEAGVEAELEVDEVPAGWMARILVSDLDLVVRNLVRNAAEVTGREGVARLAVDVDELIEDTGEESLLLRVHDTNETLLSRAQIYGREAHRGLGLVTAALTRHRGSVRCVASGRPGFKKAMEVRLDRSLQEPNATALEVAKPRWTTLALPFVVGFSHAILVPVVVVPYAVSAAVEEVTLVTQGCQALPSADPDVMSYRCPGVDAETHTLRSSLMVSWAAEAPGLSVKVISPGCPVMQLADPAQEPNAIAVDLSNCSAQLAQRNFTIIFESLLRRRSFVLEVGLSLSPEEALEALRRQTGELSVTDLAPLLERLSMPDVPEAMMREAESLALRDAIWAAVVDHTDLCRNVPTSLIGLSRCEGLDAIGALASWAVSPSETCVLESLGDMRNEPHLASAASTWFVRALAGGEGWGGAEPSEARDAFLHLVALRSLPLSPALRAEATIIFPGPASVGRTPFALTLEEGLCVLQQLYPAHLGDLREQDLQCAALAPESLSTVQTVARGITRRRLACE